MNTILTEKEQQHFTEEQLALSRQITLTDSRDFSALQTVAGVDLAYWNLPDGSEYAVCCIVVLDMPTQKVLETVSAHGAITVPYCPGYLAFRELPLVTQAVKKLQTQPELYVFDGNGYLHPRHMGIASHAALLLQKPAFGIAKT